MVNSTTLHEILKTLAEIKAFWDTIIYASQVYQNSISSKAYSYELDEISKALYKDEISINNFIECEGFLTIYSQTILPNSYPEIISLLDPHHIYGLKSHRSIQNKHFTITAPPPPVQVISPISKDISTSHRLCFLYPKNFETFLSPYDTNNRKKIIIPSSNKPFPIIINDITHNKYINNFVKIKAPLLNIPPQILECLNKLYSSLDLLGGYNENYFTPYSSVNNFICLSLLNSMAKIETTSNVPPSADGSIFVESHIEGLELLSEKNRREIIKNSIPDLDKQGFSELNSKDGPIAYGTLGFITVTYKSPATIGFFCNKTKLFNELCFREMLSELQSYIAKFNRNLQGESFSSVGIRPILKTDFVFDPTKIHLLDPRGSLNIGDEKFIHDNQKLIKLYR